MKPIHPIWTFLFLLIPLLPSGLALPQDLPAENRVTFRETVWMETGRNLYVPGEEITFLATVLEKDTYHPSRLSRFLRIELLDRSGKPLIRENIEKTGTFFRGSLTLDSDLKSGWYYLRAYTNWMRNFPVDEFTVVPVKIINPTEPPDRVDLPDRQPSGRLIPKELPLSIEKSGTNLTVSLSRLDPDTLREVRLLIHRSYSWYVFETAGVSGNTVSFTIPAGSLPDGIVQFSVVDRNRRIIARRLWWSGDPPSCDISVRTDTNTLDFRSKGRTHYRLTPTESADGPSGLFAQITLENTLINRDSLIPGLPGWSASGFIPANPDQRAIWLENHSYSDECILSFFPGESTVPADPATVNHPPLGNPGIDFYPETSCCVLSGIVSDSLTKKGAAGIGVGLNILKSNNFLSTGTDSAGHFHFAFHQDTGQLDFILSFLTDTLPHLTLLPFGTWDDRPFAPPAESFSVSPVEMELARSLSLNRQLAAIYRDSLPVSPSSIPGTTGHTPFFDPPDRTVLTDRYIELANIQEVIYEVVPDVWVRKNEGKAYITVYNSKPYSRNFGTLVLLDGIPLPDQQELLELPPSRIQSIQVKNRLFIHGDYLFAGIVNFVSRNNDFAGLKLPAKSVAGSFAVPTPLTQKNVSGRIQGSPFIPVLNPVILERELIPDSVGSFEFQTGDLPGKYRIRIFGYGRSGFWCYGSCEFSVFPPIL